MKGLNVFVCPFPVGSSPGQSQEAACGHWTHGYVIQGNGCTLCLSSLCARLFKEPPDRSFTHELINWPTHTHTHIFIHSRINVLRPWRFGDFTRDCVSCLFTTQHAFNSCNISVNLLWQGFRTREKEAEDEFCFPGSRKFLVLHLNY